VWQWDNIHFDSPAVYHRLTNQQTICIIRMKTTTIQRLLNVIVSLTSMHSRKIETHLFFYLEETISNIFIWLYVSLFLFVGKTNICREIHHDEDTYIQIQLCSFMLIASIQSDGREYVIFWENKSIISTYLINTTIIEVCSRNVWSSM